VNIPILLFNGECAVCRSIARWVKTSAEKTPGGVRILEQPIGDDPDVLQVLHPGLDIWDAYETIHILMPDGSMKLGGEAESGRFNSFSTWAIPCLPMCGRCLGARAAVFPVRSSNFCDRSAVHRRLRTSAHAEGAQ
jgi:hypothetical protein